MQLSLRTFNDMVQGMAASAQSAASQVLELSVGSTLRAILESSASVALWLQWLVVQTLQMTRAATSNGADLDSWVADFSLARLPASPASGVVTFSRYVTTSTALVPVGTQVRTIDGSQTFTVSASESDPTWASTLSGYLLGVGVPSADVPVVAQTAGLSGNVQAGSIGVFVTALPGLDQVSNAAAFVNGMDSESDSALRLRFQSYMASRSRATLGAVQFAVASVQQGLTYTIQENVDSAGTPRLGFFVITVDDGSGYPSNALLSTIYQAVDTMRPVGTLFAVLAPAVTIANISCSITFGGVGTSATVGPQVASAIQSYVNSLPVGTSLASSRIVQLAYDANPTITNVTQVELNGQTADLTVSPFGIIRAGTVAVN